VPHLLVVGAGPGIAASTARRLGRDGCAVSLIARRAGALAELRAALRQDGVRVEDATAEAGNAQELAVAIDALIGEHGPVDVLLYNVSAGREATVTDLSGDELLDDLAAGVAGMQTAVRAVLPGMRERGSGTILATGGGSADSPVVSMATLGVQKAALRALVEVQAKTLTAEGIHVATVMVRGFVGKQIHPDRVADLYADLVAETAGPRENWRTVVDLRP
jgi:short-subunit dehydrogenase